MADEVYSVSAIHDLMSQMVELHSMTIGMVAGTNINAGIWTEAEAVWRLRQIAEGATSTVAKAVYENLAAAIEKGDGPHLTIIDGGKAG